MVGGPFVRTNRLNRNRAIVSSYLGSVSFRFGRHTPTCRAINLLERHCLESIPASVASMLI